MNDPQIWTLIGVFAAAMFGVIGVIMTTFTRTMRLGFARLEEKFDGKFGVIDERFKALNERFTVIDERFRAMDPKIDGLRSEMNTRFDTVDRRIDRLDADVNALMKHTFGIGQ